MNSKTEVEALEHIMSDTGAEPIKLSYSLMRSITNNFSIEIGRGGFGVVYKGVLQYGDVAVKKLSNPHALSDKQFLDEITCLKKAKHKNIVRFLGYCSETQGELLQFEGANIMAEVMNKLLCFEFVPSGNIQHYLQQGKPDRNDWHVRYQMIRGILEGLHYLHDQKIYHLDLKPENVMLDARMNPKITDFGLSRCLDKGKSKVITQRILGTPQYIAPEVIDKGEISFRSDIYALGIVIIELLTGISRIGLDNWDESLDFGCPRVRRCAEIARNCMDHDGHNRPTVREIIRDLDELECSLELRNGTSFSINKVVRTVSFWTHLPDVYPVELRFPFVPNQKMPSHVTITNKGRGIFYSISVPSSDRYSESCQFVPPNCTSVIPLIREAEEELPSGKNELVVVVITARSDYAIQIFQKRIFNILVTDKPYTDLLFGYEFHVALLTAVVAVSENEDQAALHPSSMDDIIGHKEEEKEKPISIYTMDVHPTEPWVLIAPDADTVYIWNWQTKQRIQAYKRERTSDAYGPKEKKMSAIFIGRMQWVVIGDIYGYICVHTCPGLGKVKKFKGHGDGVTSLAVHPTQPFMLSCSGTSLMKLWDWSKDWLCAGAFDISEPVKQVMFNPRDVGSFATYHDDRTIQIWRIGRPMYIWKTTKLATYPSTSHFFTYSDDRHLIAHISVLGGIMLSDFINGKAVHHFHNVAAAFTTIVSHPTLPVFVTATNDGSILVWDCSTGMLKKIYVNLPKKPMHIGFTGSGRLVIGYTHEVSVLDIDLE